MCNYLGVMFVRFLMKLEYSRQFFGKYINIKFHDNPSSGSRVVLMWTGGRTDMTKQTIAFRNFEGAHNKQRQSCGRCLIDISRVTLNQKTPRILVAVCPVTGTWSHSDHKFTVGLHHNEHVMTSNTATFQVNTLCQLHRPQR